MILDLIVSGGWEPRVLSLLRNEMFECWCRRSLRRRITGVKIVSHDTGSAAVDSLRVRDRRYVTILIRSYYCQTMRRPDLF